MSLDSSIRRLLFDHELVIIPDFGGFLTQYRPAHVHALSGMIHPPSRVLAFNRRLSANDGLLAHELMRVEGIGFDQAMDRIRSQVSVLEDGLSQHKRASLEGIGVIYRDEENNYRFSPVSNVNFLKDSFGLGSIALNREDASPVLEIVREEPAEEVQAETPVVEFAPADQEENVEKSGGRRRKYLAVAAVVLPLALLGGAWLFRDHLPIQAQSLGISTSEPVVVKAEFQPRFEEEDIRFDYPVEEDHIQSIASSNPALGSIYFDFTENEMNPNGIRVVLKEGQPLPPERERPDDTTPVETVNDRLSHKYFIVGGAFSVEANARRMVRKLEGKGYEAYIFGQRKGLFMVCYGGYADKVEARKALARVRAEENPKAWFKRK